MRPMKPYKLLTSILVAFLCVCISSAAPAQTYKVLYAFHGAPSDGSEPQGTLVRDAAGNLYGTTLLGGSGKCAHLPGCGTVFTLNKSGKELAVFSFDGEGGALPEAGLSRDSTGNLYGSTTWGGVKCPGNGCGTIFQLNQAGKFRSYSFAGQPDGAGPTAAPIELSGGLYGTTGGGGASGGDTGGFGTLFTINPQGKETVLYSFGGEADVCNPSTGITADSKGNLYGVALDNEPGCGRSGGTAYELDTAEKFTVLFTFSEEAGLPGSASSLILDSQGNLYGNGTYGGSNEAGTVFELSPQANGTWSGRALYSFCSLPSCADGANPWGSSTRLR